MPALVREPAFLPFPASPCQWVGRCRPRSGGRRYILHDDQNLERNLILTVWMTGELHQNDPRLHWRDNHDFREASRERFRHLEGETPSSAENARAKYWGLENPQR